MQPSSRHIRFFASILTTLVFSLALPPLGAQTQTQAMTMNQLGGLVGVPGVGPSYDESLGEAVQNAAKAVQKAIQQK